MIRCTKNNLFGGFTESSWAGDGVFRGGCSWIFTLKNPYSIQPQQFFPKPNTDNDVYCSYAFGPTFGHNYPGYDIQVAGNPTNRSTIAFPNTYVDTTGKGEHLFTGENYFQPNEVEVFLIQ